MLSVSYDGALVNNSLGEGDIYITTENIFSDLLQADIGQDKYCPVVLVGHSFAGLVIKHLCNHAHRMLSKKQGWKRSRWFLDSIQAVFYYATPYYGSAVPVKLEKFLPEMLLKLIKGGEMAWTWEIRQNMHFHGKKIKSDEAWRTKPLLLVLDETNGERDEKLLFEMSELWLQKVAFFSPLGINALWRAFMFTMSPSSTLKVLSSYFWGMLFETTGTLLECLKVSQMPLLGSVMGYLWRLRSLESSWGHLRNARSKSKLYMQWKRQQITQT